MRGADDPTEPKIPALNPVNDSEIRGMLEDPIGSPLANDPIAGKSSLGGVQPKIVLVKTEMGWAQALGGFPTTHILKPVLSGGLESTIFDEEYGSRIARGMGLLDFATDIHEFDGNNALVIERYDRRDGLRMHQEDFSQALGVSGNGKYQEVGGVVSLQRVASVLHRHASGIDLRRLARMVILAVAIGNLDMHTKNIGLLHGESGDVTLAPAYDVVPQSHMNNDGKLALAVNKKYRHNDLTREDLFGEFQNWSLKASRKVIDETLEEIGALVKVESPLDGAYPALQEQIASFVDNLQSGKPVRDG